ncbi:MAG TPA: helix-turn-helix domain-containing protein [Solirubrobacteraceae bacterium]|nr:helix-turn-helix domain-containing protein [Solirubrobacteraceae bacterium]
MVHESAALGRLEQDERAPHPLLAGVVRRYCGYDHDCAAATRRREVAQDEVTIILSLGPLLRIGGPDHPADRYASFVAALTDTFAITEHDGALRGIEVNLSPLGAHMLFGVPMHELSSKLVLPLEDVLGAEAGELAERLELARSWSARFAILDRFILRRVHEARRPSPDVDWAWRRLRATGGLLPVGELARELGCSRRHLIGRFREQVGPAPKTAARLVRFQRTVRLLQRHDGSRFAEIAHRCGYYDQAHMNREFRELAGAAPGEFVARLLPDGLGVAAD